MLRSLCLVSLALASCTHAAARAPQPQATPGDPAALFARLAPSIVFTRWQHETADKITLDTGVGVVIDDAGLVLTTCHQLTDSNDHLTATALEVLLAEPDPPRHTFRPSAPVKADVVVCVEEPDLALIRLRGGSHGRAPVAVAPALPAPGERLIAIGATHLGFLWTVQECLVSGVGDQRDTGTVGFAAATAERAAETRADMSPGTMLQSGCHINPMSGSPSLDAAGRITGLHLFSRFNTDEPPEEVNYFIAVDEIRRFLDQHLPATSSARSSPTPAPAT